MTSCRALACGRRRVLEAVVAHKAQVDPAIYAKILDFTKLFWANNGNHNEMTSQKFLPKFTADELKTRARAGGPQGSCDGGGCAQRSRLFDPEFRADDHGQESERRKRHHPGERQQFLFRRDAGGSEGLHRTLPAEFPRGEGERQARGTGLSRGHAGRQIPPGSMRNI